MYGPSESVDDGTRRSVYSTISRGRSTSDVMKLYDVPAPLAHIPMRVQTLNPLQALFVMNSAFIQGLAQTLADQVAANATPETRIQSLYRKMFARNPTAEEVSLGVQYLTAPGNTLERYAQALLSTNEVIFWP
jgi:hypothetical protein